MLLNDEQMRFESSQNSFCYILTILRMNIWVWSFSHCKKKWVTLTNGAACKILKSAIWAHDCCQGVNVLHTVILRLWHKFTGTEFYCERSAFFHWQTNTHTPCQNIPCLMYGMVIFIAMRMYKIDENLVVVANTSDTSPNSVLWLFEENFGLQNWLVSWVGHFSWLSPIASLYRRWIFII